MTTEFHDCDECRELDKDVTVRVMVMPIEPHTKMGGVVTPEMMGSVVLFEGQRVILGATSDRKTLTTEPKGGDVLAIVKNADPDDTREPIISMALHYQGWVIVDFRDKGEENES